MARRLADLYRRERRRLRADEAMIESGVARSIRREVWRLTPRAQFTSLKAAVRRWDARHPLGAKALGGIALRHRMFPGWSRTEGVIAWGRAICRQSRKRSARRAQLERMIAHQLRTLPVARSVARMARALADDLQLLDRNHDELARAVATLGGEPLWSPDDPKGEREPRLLPDGTFPGSEP